jgi:hypothetical protein
MTEKSKERKVSELVPLVISDYLEDLKERKKYLEKLIPSRMSYEDSTPEIDDQIKDVKNDIKTLKYWINTQEFLGNLAPIELEKLKEFVEQHRNEEVRKREADLEELIEEREKTPGAEGKLLELTMEGEIEKHANFEEKTEPIYDEILMLIDNLLEYPEVEEMKGRSVAELMKEEQNMKKLEGLHPVFQKIIRKFSKEPGVRGV